jgi:hypothetical protein
MRAGRDRVVFRLLGLYIEAEGSAVKMVAVCGTLLTGGGLALLWLGPTVAAAALARYLV